jgi:UDP-glucose 4-epimerase
MFAADDAPRPSDPYGVSKLEAESSLKQVAVDTGMQVAIIRPPLIYGPGVKANFRKMMQWVNAGIPLPLGNIRNRRSLVGIQNLVDLIEIGISHEAAGNQTFMVSDGNDVSTSELLRQMAKALGVQSRLVSVPQSWIERFAALIGRSDLAQRLCGSLRIDIEKTRSLLGWNPSVSLEDGLRAVVASNRKNDF